MKSFFRIIFLPTPFIFSRFRDLIEKKLIVFFRVGENLYNERVNSFQKIKEADLALKPLIWY